ncbi:hypothetical protein SVAN01_07942 [Stagonosporopsis vannaccii]|nr:hypothetical protein SVAN01_07942 [Stagonosporopsis vannaccii]
MSHGQLVMAPSSPMSRRRYTRMAQLSTSLPAADLRSRVSALDRRCDMLSTILGRLVAVMELSRSAKAKALCGLDLNRILEEGVELCETMQDPQGQLDEVRDMLKDLMVERRDVVTKLQSRKGNVWVKGPAKCD